MSLLVPFTFVVYFVLVRVRQRLAERRNLKSGRVKGRAAATAAARMMTTKKSHDGLCQTKEKEEDGNMLRLWKLFTCTVEEGVHYKI